MTDTTVRTNSGTWRRLGALREPGPGTSRAPYGWAPVIVVVFISLVDRIEYSLLPAVLPQLQAEWGFSDAVAGSIPTASALTATALAIPAGILADRWDRTRLLVFVVLAWSLATLGSALAPGLVAFYAIRVLLASAEAIDNPSVGSLLADWYPPSSRATVFGWWRIAGYLGGIGLMIGGILAETIGWRGTFVVMTVPGLIAALLASLLREPVRGHVDRLAAAELNAETGVGQNAWNGGTGSPGGGDVAAVLSTSPEQDSRTLLDRARSVLRTRTLWGTSAALTVSSFAVASIIFWGPTLLQREFDLREAAAGSVAGGVSLLGVIGGAGIAARICERPRAGSPAQFAVTLGSVGLLIGSLFLGLALLADQLRLFALGLFFFAFFSAFAVPTLTKCVADSIRAADRGTAFGLLQVVATLGAAFGPLVAGSVSDATGSLRTGLWVMVPMMALSALLAATAYRTVDADARTALLASAAPPRD